ncbi:uncharacterized protein LOC122071509 [Macadamia integrifolia]|uniref:uncharacterized protein LOC122071509 n=1 Tax=Macadamia integrifolia TaxID=60698 RepID=UPI001C4EDFB1|nr:uncharacterized protein LOC122071509 [Macadamia integrifolia]
MKSTSKMVMGVTLAMVVSLAIVLALVLVLLAELYCSLLLRRRRLRITTTINATSTSTHQSLQQETSSVPPPLNSIYAQGVLNAPRRFLFPAFIGKEVAEEEKGENFKKFPVLESGLHQVEGEIISTPQRIGLFTASSPSLSIKSLASPRPKQAAAEGNGGGGGAGEHFVYISNPIYDNDACRVNRVGVETPFETPETSPSRLEMSGNDDDDGSSSKSLSMTPPLSPMKKLPAEACSVSLRDARSIGTSGSGSDTKNCSSSSSSGSPRTSPSW